MSARVGRSFILFFLFTSGLVTAGLAACEPAPSEPPPQTPKSGTRPPDRTEVTMEVSTALPPGEAAPPSSSAPSSSATAEPPPSASDPSEDPMIGGAQPDAALERAVAPVRPRLRACYKKALAAEPGVAGSATFDATIGKDGRAASARFVKRDGLSEDMVGCLLAVVKAMTFEPSKKSQIVTLSFGAPPPVADAGPAR